VVTARVFFSISDPRRAALKLTASAPATRSGPADVELRAASLPSMLIRAATCTGLRYGAGTPRQDAFALRWRGRGETEQVIAVVCDGVGQFGRSDEAALIAGRCLVDLSAQGVSWPDPFEHAYEELHKAAAEAPAADTADAAEDGTAMTAVAVAWPSDSTPWHLSSESRWTLLTSSSDAGMEADYHSTGIRPPPSADGGCASCGFRVRWGTLSVMTDGVANPLKWSDDVQETLEQWWWQPPDPVTSVAQVGFFGKSHVMTASSMASSWTE
jgi:hypothetical protein